MEVGGQCHALAANSWERPGTHCIGGWLVLWGAENLASTRIRSPDHPARSESLHRLSYPGPRVVTA